MKKVLSIIAMATLAVLFCGCNKENVPATDSKSLTVSVAMPDDEISTKTVLNGTTLTWTDTDKIYVAAPNHGKPMWGLNVFAINPATLSTDGKLAEFVDQSGTDWTGADRYVVLYGKLNGGFRFGGWYCEGISTPGSQSYMKWNNACEQKYRRSGGPDPNILAMASTVTPSLDRVQLSNLMSIIKLPVKNSGVAATLSSIKVTCDNEPISGPFVCCVHTNIELAEGSIKFRSYAKNKPSEEPIAEDYSTGIYGNWVKLCDINVALTDSSQDFYLVVFPGAHGNLTFTLTDSNDNSKVFNWNTPFTSEGGKIYNFPAIDWNN